MKKIHNRNTVLTFTVCALVFMSCKNTGTSKKEQNKNYNYTQIATGQVKAYGEDGEILSDLTPGDALYGQDANYLKGE
ncbi:hypothetical protein MPF19_10940 [Polaribacter sp. Z014]|uniref:hypothetical protein n=1 Tax=Polaribacter sp. Z014 TaxID=2927126 RepID=UPI002020CCC2|nr:hypothetical protein [Polaribacter sp. Z014]MCL7763934.1 hypothetical protein [Polaribacter sp. Z014]